MMKGEGSCTEAITRATAGYLARHQSSQSFGLHIIRRRILWVARPGRSLCSMAVTDRRNDDSLSKRYCSQVFTVTTAMASADLDAADALVRSLSPGARRTYALGGTQKYELPTSEVSLSQVRRSPEQSRCASCFYRNIYVDIWLSPTARRTYALSSTQKFILKSRTLNKATSCRPARCRSARCQSGDDRALPHWPRQQRHGSCSCLGRHSAAPRRTSRLRRRVEATWPGQLVTARG